MPLTCNIDARGKAFRIVWGMICLISAAITAFLWAWPAQTALAWGVTGLLASLGMLGVYSGRKGWCALRAMGFKTPV